MTRTSLTHPLKIAEISLSGELGKIGVTFCPGKTQPAAGSGAWSRDLGLDLDVIADWDAAAVVSLIEDHEFRDLNVPALGEQVRVRHMAWYHLPIRDVGVPCHRFEQDWHRKGAELRSIISNGCNVLVHCKGGLGRAGMIAARLMAELGVPPNLAVEEVRKARPGAIETEAQRRQVMATLPVEPSVPDTSAEAIQDRAIGALMGLAIGDALGTTLEFKPRDSYVPLTDIIGSGPFRLKPGEWTDDTAMALALADSLIIQGTLDEHDLMTRFVAWHERGDYSCTGTCFDIGITTRLALQRFKQTGNPIAGSGDPNTAGNGSLMRLAPVAIRYHRDRGLLRDVAARQSRTTHGAVEAVDACVAFAEMLADAIAGRPINEVLSASRSISSDAIGLIVTGSWRGKKRASVMSSGYVAHSLEAALWSTARSGTFEQAVLTAANLGDDADTTAAITGQLAGAVYGAKAIPASWLSRLAWRDKIEEMATNLLQAG